MGINQGGKNNYSLPFGQLTNLHLRLLLFKPIIDESKLLWTKTKNPCNEKLITKVFQPFQVPFHHQQASENRFLLTNRSLQSL